MQACTLVAMKLSSIIAVRRCIALALAIMVLMPALAVAQSEAANAPLPGGSNYLLFGSDGTCSESSRDAFGVTKRYHEVVDGVPVRSIAREQLAAMRKRGMRRLSLGVYFMHQPPESGVLVDSSDAAEVAQTVSNIATLLADVRAAGYSEVLFRFFPNANINPRTENEGFPHHESAEYPARVDEYWNLVQKVRPALVASGLSYRIDLGVELAPRDSDLFYVPSGERYKYPANQTWSRTVRTLWQRYVAAYGSSDTVGFSFAVFDDRDRIRSQVRHMRYVYEGRYPPVFALDLYATPKLDEGEKFALMDEMFRSQNPTGARWNDAPWIIAEAYYEDPLAAEAIAAAMAETGREVLYLTQWPLDRAGECDSPHVNVVPPYEWRVYPAYGLSVTRTAKPALDARCGLRCGR